jgi:hypothetical protein
VPDDERLRGKFFAMSNKPPTTMGQYGDGLTPLKSMSQWLQPTRDQYVKEKKKIKQLLYL